MLTDWKPLAALCVLTVPLYAQYGGPAVLTRGQAPAAMATPQIDFRPYFNIAGGYDSGLNGVGVDPNGQPYDESSFGIEAGGGVSGIHSWRHTQVGLDYRFNARHYPNRSFYDGIDQSLMLGITQALSRHVQFSVRTAAGFYTQNYSTFTLGQTVPFDPATTYIPTNDFFDNRTSYISTQADLTVQKSTRLSYSLGGDFFANRRRSEALTGVVGHGARGDVQYRASRRSTVGVGYTFTHYEFTRIFSSTDLHSFVGSYAIRLSRSFEFTATGGGMRYETKFIQNVPVDPAIAAIIGISSLRQITYTKSWIPTISARLSYTMKRGVAFVNGGRSITPGNGLFLTSSSTYASAGYAYTALKRWSANLNATYNRSQSLGNYIGQYGSYAFNVNVGRQVMRYTHARLSVAARKYESPDFNNYNKWSYQLRLGLTFAPGDIPIRLW
jgi:hypothetical protein